MSVEAPSGSDRPRSLQLACPTQTDREPEQIDPDDPRVSEDLLCSHCFPDGEIPEDVDVLLSPRRYSNGLHLPLAYDGEQCKFGSYDDYTSYKALLTEITVEEFDALVAGEISLEDIDRLPDRVID